MSIKLAMIALPLIAISVPSHAAGKGKDRVELALERIISGAKRDEAAAKADWELVNQAGLGMHRALRAGGPTADLAVNASLQSLRTKHPDSRLNYSGPKDRCQVFDAFADIRRDSLSRSARALNVIVNGYTRLEIYHSVLAEVAFAMLTGRPVTDTTIRDGFIKTIDAEQELSVFSSTDTTSLASDNAPSDSECTRR